MTEVTPQRAMYYEDLTYSGADLTDIALYAHQIEAIFSGFDLSVLEGFSYHETGLPEGNLVHDPWVLYSAPFLDPDFDLARPCDTQTLEITLDGGNRVDHVIDDFSGSQQLPEEDLELTGKNYGEECNDIGNSMSSPANDIIELPACLKSLEEASVAVSQSTPEDNIDKSFETCSSKTLLTSYLGTNGVAATRPTSTKLYCHGKKRRRSREDNEADMFPRKRTLRSSDVVEDPAKKRVLNNNFVDINDHVTELQSKISEVLEKLHQILIALGPVDLEHFLNFSYSWKLHHTRKDASSRIMPRQLRTLRRNFDNVLQLPGILPGNDLVRQSCSDLEDAFTEYDSLHLQLISEPRPRTKRVSK